MSFKRVTLALNLLHCCNLPLIVYCATQLAVKRTGTGTTAGPDPARLEVVP
jgi:hypothetical protein